MTAMQDDTDTPPAMLAAFDHPAGRAALAQPGGATGWAGTLLHVHVAPAGSAAALSSPSVANPTFTPDLAGSYQFSLTVTDTLGRSSPPGLVAVQAAVPTLLQRWAWERARLWSRRRAYFKARFQESIIQEAMHPRRIAERMELYGELPCY